MGRELRGGVGGVGVEDVRMVSLKTSGIAEGLQQRNRSNKGSLPCWEDTVLDLRAELGS